LGAPSTCAENYGGWFLQRNRKRRFDNADKEFLGLMANGGTTGTTRIHPTTSSLCIEISTTIRLALARDQA